MVSSRDALSSLSITDCELSWVMNRLCIALASNLRLFFCSSTGVQVAINCGGTLDVLSGLGVIFQKDVYYTGGDDLIIQPYEVFLPYGEHLLVNTTAFVRSSARVRKKIIERSALRECSNLRIIGLAINTSPVAMLLLLLTEGFLVRFDGKLANLLQATATISLRLQVASGTISSTPVLVKATSRTLCRFQTDIMKWRCASRRHRERQSTSVSLA